ncbi:MAG: phosphotransferase [Cyanobacteria bacterium P01_D01_bin.73]
MFETKTPTFSSGAPTNPQEFFPAVYSTLSSEALRTQVLPQFGLVGVKGVYFWHRGLSDVYLVQAASEQFILRISHHHWRSRGEVYFELEFLEFLQRCGMPISAPIPTSTNSLAVDLDAPEGKRYAALFRRAPGDVLLGDLDQEHGRILGQTLAHMHQASHEFRSAHYRPPLDAELLLRRSLTVIEPFLRERPEDWDYLCKTAEVIESTMNSLVVEIPCRVVCWGDPHSGNVHFLNRKPTLFDFDQCGYGPRAFDLAKFLQVSMQGGLNKRNRDALFEGYQQVITLTDEELASLQQLTQAAHIWSWSIGITMAMFNDYSRLTPRFFTNRLQQLKRLTTKDWALF